MNHPRGSWVPVGARPRHRLENGVQAVGVVVFAPAGDAETAARGGPPPRCNLINEPEDRRRRLSIEPSAAAWRGPTAADRPL